MSKPRILVQLDSDPHASVFDSVVAVDSDVDHLLAHHSVAEEQVQGLVHGAMFTRGPADLKSTAIFIGGSDVSAGERLLKQVTNCFFGPMRVSVMLDANGANTTAAAAVLSAADHLDLSATTALVLGGTGPVGRRAAGLLAHQGARVRIGSRSADRAEQVCAAVRECYPNSSLEPHATADTAQTAEALKDCQLVIAAGTVGVQLLAHSTRREADALRVAIDLNAVPPLGIEAVEVTAKAEEQSGVICYGAIGVGGRKMKIHKACIRQLFTANDQVLDAEQILAIGQGLS